MTFLEAYNRGLLDVDDDTFGIFFPAIALLTDDDYLLVAQRGKKGVDKGYAPGRFSPSCEEGWDPSRENSPHQTVLRGLSEEWNLDPLHGVEIPDSAVRLVAIGREWGMFWNTVLIYVVDLPCSFEKALDCWDSVPPDRAEASAVGAIPVKTARQRETVLNIAKTRRLMPQDLAAGCGAKWRGNPTINQLHDSTGVARILFALAHRFGVASLMTAPTMAQ